MNCNRLFQPPFAAAVIAAAVLTPSAVRAAPRLTVGIEEMRGSWDSATAIPADAYQDPAIREILQQAEGNARLAG